MAHDRHPAKIKADSLGSPSPSLSSSNFFLQSFDLARHKRFMRSLLDKAMSCVLFNYMEPNGFGSTLFVNFRPKCILGHEPQSDVARQTLIKSKKNKVIHQRPDKESNNSTIV